MRRKEIKKAAKLSLDHKYGHAILSHILWSLVLGGSAIFGLLIGWIVVSGAIKVSKKSFYLDIATSDFKGIDSSFDGFKYFSKSLRATIRIMLRTIVLFLFAALPFLVMLLLRFTVVAEFGSFPTYNVFSSVTMTIGPISFAVMAILFPIRYIVSVSFTFSIMADKDYAKLNPKECINKSKMISKGNLWRIVFFELSFILWRLGCLLTLNALTMYFTPYYEASVAQFYLSLKDKENIEKEDIAPTY